MLTNIRNQKKRSMCRFGFAIIAAVIMLAGFYQSVFAADAKQKSFKSPEDAVKALINAVKGNDTKELLTIFGLAGKELIFSGDEVADKAGKEEILNRRIGRNELNVIQVCLAYVDAQREYVLKDRDSDKLLEYAQKFASDKGQKNGLYWEAKEGEEQSPLGPLAAKAAKEGYTGKKSGDKPTPYHGYHHKILKAQGKNAPGGEYDYMVKGKMIGGFALVAYPAEYGNSGVMTFIVNQDGVVYEKDLGKDTEKIATAMKKFDPDKTWKKIE